MRHHWYFVIFSAALGLGAAALAEELPPPEGAERITIVGTPRKPNRATTTVPPFTLLYQFPGTKDVYDPRGGLAMDSKGNLYGTTYYGGKSSTSGVIYRLTPPKSGNGLWTYTLLHSGTLFKQGIAPTAPLTIVGETIYGTMGAGGSPACGCGVVFKISTNGTGYHEFHVFGPDFPAKQVHGATPWGGLLIIGDTMYGTTTAGGKYYNGVLFKMSTGGGGYSVLHHFEPQPGCPVDECQNSGPEGELVLGKDGLIYGTQFGGGKYNQGMIFRIAKNGSGFQDLYDFKGVNQPGNSTDGAQPQGRLAVGSDGTIYGTTAFGGTPSDYGTAWSWSAADGYHQLYRFEAYDFYSANIPHSGLVIDGNVLYGAGAGGGEYQCGAIYKLTPPTSGTLWNYNTLYSDACFPSDPAGDIAFADLLLNNHLLYGANAAGGPATENCEVTDTNIGCGTVFRINPANSP